MSRQDSSSSGSSYGSDSNPMPQQQQNYNMQSYDSGNQMMENANSSVGNMGYNQGDMNMGYINQQNQPQQQTYMQYSDQSLTDDSQILTPTCSGYSMNPPANYMQTQSYTTYPNPTSSSSGGGGGGLPPASSLFSNSSLSMDYNRGSSSAPPIHSTGNVFLQNQPTYGNAGANQPQPLPPLSSSFAQPQVPYGQQTQTQPLPRTPMSAPAHHTQQTQSPSMPPPSPFVNSGNFQETPTSMNPPQRVDSVSSEPAQTHGPPSEFRPPSSSFSNPGSTMSAPPESPAVNRPPSAKSHQPQQQQHGGSAYPQQQQHSGQEYYLQGMNVRSMSMQSQSQIDMQQQQGSTENVLIQSSPQANIYVHHLPPMQQTQQQQMVTDQQQMQSGSQDHLKPPKNPPRYRNPGSYSPRGGNKSRTTSLSTMLPMLRAPTGGLTAGDDGPTVRQHLQQQQMAQKQRMQQEMMEKRMKEDEMKQGVMVHQQQGGMPMHIQQQEPQQNIQMTYLPPHSMSQPQTAYIQVISADPHHPPPPQHMTMLAEPPKPIQQQQQQLPPPQQPQPPAKKPAPKRVRPSRAKAALTNASAIITTTPTDPNSDSQSSGPPPKANSRAAKRNVAQTQHIEDDSVQSPSKQKYDTSSGQTQCRIVHFQKPPVENEFPQTETTIHVVQAPPPYSIQVHQGQQPQQMQIYQAQVQPGVVQQQTQQQYFIVEQVQTPSGQQQTRQQMFIPASPTKQQQGYPQVQQIQQPYAQQEGQPGVVRAQQGVVSVQQYPSVAQIQQNETFSQESMHSEMSHGGDGQNFDRPQQQHFIIQASPTVVEASGRVMADGVTTTVYSTILPPPTPGTPSTPRPQIVRTAPNQNVMVAPANGGPGPPQGQVYRNGVTGSRPTSAAKQKQIEEEKKYEMKTYYLKRTIKSLCYKNSALCDEVARLHERIATVTEERKVLAKRLQHYERNRIRRLQTQQRKAVAAAAAKAGTPLPSTSKKGSAASRPAPMTAPVTTQMPNFSFGKPADSKPKDLMILIQNPKDEMEKIDTKFFSPSVSTGSAEDFVTMPISIQPPENFGLSVITTLSPMTTPGSGGAMKITPSPRSTRSGSLTTDRTSSQDTKLALHIDSGEPSPTQRELRERRGSANRSLTTGPVPQTKPSPGTRSSARQQEIQQKKQLPPTTQQQQLQPTQLRARSKSSVSPTVKPEKPLSISTMRASTERDQDLKISPNGALSSPGGTLVSPRSGPRKQKLPSKKDFPNQPESEELDASLSNVDEMTPEPDGSEESCDTSKSNTPTTSARKQSNANSSAAAAAAAAAKSRPLPTRAPSKRKAKKL